MSGTHSSRRINALAAAMRARRYLEVGVNKGETFLAVEIAEKTAVDPEFRFDWQAAADAASGLPPGAVGRLFRDLPRALRHRLPRRAACLRPDLPRLLQHARSSPTSAR